MRMLWVLAGALLLQEPADEVTRKLAERAERAAGWLTDADADLRAMGRKEIRSLGSAALPSLEKLLSEKGVLELAMAWRDVAGPAGGGAKFVAEAELDEAPPDDPAVRELQKVDKVLIDKYLRAKYAEALAFVRKKSYQRAYDLAGALLTLEPRAAVADSVRKLRRHCDAMILQTTLLEAKLLHAKPSYVIGDVVELSLRLKNIFRSGLTVSFGKGLEGQPLPKGVVIVEVETTIREFYAHSQTWTRSQEVHIDNEIPVAPGAQWERSFGLDPDAEVADQEHVREIIVNAWTQPAGIEIEGRDAGRRIQFESAFIRLVPKKYAHLLENPLEQLGKSIESGRSAQETYICSRLLDGPDRDAGARRLIDALGKTENPKYKTSLSWILKGLTGQTLGEDPKAWRDWLDAKGKKTK